MAWRYFSCSRLLDESDDDAGAKKQDNNKLIFSLLLLFRLFLLAFTMHTC